MLDQVHEPLASHVRTPQMTNSRPRICPGDTHWLCKLAREPSNQMRLMFGRTQMNAAGLRSPKGLRHDSFDMYHDSIA
eukprot:808640-Pyramimonas_sp.AAC.1